MRQIGDAILRLGDLALKFGQVNRVTYHQDGVTPESDTDHTVMLGLIACAYAKEKAPELDLGKIAQFALVHDFVEVYAGDTDTLVHTSDTDKKEKDAREKLALERLRKEFGPTLPWLHETIEAYESLATPEARFVKTMDKCMPKTTHALNDARALRERSLSASDFERRCSIQRVQIEKSYGHDQPHALALFNEIYTRVRDVLP